MSKKLKIFILLFFIAFMLIGVFLLYLGFTGITGLYSSSKNYEKVNGYLVDYDLYSEDGYNMHLRHESTDDSYTLIYGYVVDGQEYTVSTDCAYGSYIVPKIGSQKKIKYNPDNPGQAYVVGYSKNNLVIFLGIFFIGAPLLILIGQVHEFSSNVREIVLGFALVLTGWGILCLVAGGTAFREVFNYCISSFSGVILIPIWFIAVGIMLLIKNFFFSKKSSS